jgi:hypothetical protein
MNNFINQAAHDRLNKARDAYWEATKSFHPMQNVAHLPEKIELELAIIAHQNNCECMSLKAILSKNEQPKLLEGE